MKKRYVFNTRFIVQSHDNKTLIKNNALKHEKEFSCKKSYLSEILIFNSPFEAEEYIWLHNCLEIDPTLRAITFDNN